MLSLPLKAQELKSQTSFQAPMLQMARAEVSWRELMTLLQHQRNEIHRQRQEIEGQRQEIQDLRDELATTKKKRDGEKNNNSGDKNKAI